MMIRKIIILLPVWWFGISFPAQAQTVNWAKDIAPILYKNCATCHHPGGLAPFSLLGYEAAFQRRFSIAHAVETRAMPPWPPDPEYVALAHPRVLKESEIELVRNWVAAGAPAGELVQAPDPPVFNSVERITQPDLALQIPTYVSQAETEDIYRCFPIRTGLTTDRVLKAIECVPGNPEIVHHVLIFVDESDRAFALDAADPGPGYTSFGGVGSNSAKLIGAWAPGGEPYFFPEGMGKTLAAGATVILQIHYPAGTKGKTDRTKINLLLSGESSREVYFEPAINHYESLINGPLFIPANSKKTFQARVLLPADVTVISVAPHMHLLGRKIKAFGVTPAGDTIPLIKIEDWDFHWQYFYSFQRATVLPKGTRIYAEAEYDNTSDNPKNPNRPPRDVQVGEATTDEMFLIYFAFLAYERGDEQIVLGDPGQNTATGEKEKRMLPEISVSPNPLAEIGRLQFALPVAQKVRIDLFDASGRLLRTLLQQNLAGGNHAVELDLSGQVKGMYYVRCLSSDYYGVVPVMKW